METCVGKALLSELQIRTSLECTDLDGWEKARRIAKGSPPSIVPIHACSYAPP